MLQKTMLKLLTIIVMIACVVIASASSTTTSKSVDATHTKDPQMEKFMNELTPKQRECFKESWKKDKDMLKAGMKACKDKNGGPACIKAIPKLKPCFA